MYVITELDYEKYLKVKEILGFSDERLKPPLHFEKYTLITSFDSGYIRVIDNQLNGYSDMAYLESRVAEKGIEDFLKGCKLYTYEEFIEEFSSTKKIKLRYEMKRGIDG